MRKYVYLCTAALLISCTHVEKTPQYSDMIANIDPFSIGSVTISLDQAFSSKVKSEAADVVFYPRENEVALEFPYNMGQYRVFWSKEGRRLFIEALNRYNEDFTNQKLMANSNNFRAVYGQFNGRLQWKTLSISATYRSSPVVELGYRFRDNAPYFTARYKAAKEETGANSKGIKESPQVFIYFTRAQGEELAKLFEETFLLSTVEGKEPLPAIEDTRDVYIPRDNSYQEKTETRNDEFEISETNEE